jgi:hypothetical protein
MSHWIPRVLGKDIQSGRKLVSLFQRFKEGFTIIKPIIPHTTTQYFHRKDIVEIFYSELEKFVNLGLYKVKDESGIKNEQR